MGNAARLKLGHDRFGSGAIVVHFGDRLIAHMDSPEEF
jgi:hypothetical protein